METHCPIAKARNIVKRKIKPQIVQGDQRAHWCFRGACFFQRRWVSTKHTEKLHETGELLSFISEEFQITDAPEFLFDKIYVYTFCRDWVKYRPMEDSLWVLRERSHVNNLQKLKKSSTRTPWNDPNNALWERGCKRGKVSGGQVTGQLPPPPKVAFGCTS